MQPSSENDRLNAKEGAGALQPEQRQSLQNRPHNAEAVSQGASLPWHQKRAQEAAGGDFGRCNCPTLAGPRRAEWGGLRPGRAGERPSGMEGTIEKTDKIVR